MDSPPDFKSIQDRIQSSLVATTRTANRIASQDLSFQRTLDPSVADQLDEKSARLLRLSKGLLESAAKATGQKAPDLEDVDDIDISWRATVDVIDSLLEKADTCLDEYTGLVKRKAGPLAETGPMPKKPKQTDRLEHSMRRANILKPQNVFESKPDNFPTGPWKPLLSQKPHASIPLDKSLDSFVDEENNTQYKHPYETEISTFRYPDSLYQKKEPVRYWDVEKSPAKWVDTFEGVLALLEELKKAPEIAIDLEHHDYRSYNGLTSLMQISTRDQDWIVDTLKPWRHRLEILNEVFADPTKVKIFHGAYMDIIWLQRDLGLYIVGLFDTFHACEALGYPARSLAYLLKRFVDFDADKKYQMADWRIRPLPEEMLYYARSDTHYLLYIFDMLRNELLDHTDRTNPEKDLMGWVLQRSKETSLNRYSHLECNAETGRGARGWLNLLCKTPASLNNQQFAVYRAVHQWRDNLARREDESPVYIMPQQAVMEIAKIMPGDTKALHSCLGYGAPTVKSSISDLFKVVQDAMTQGVNGPSLMEFYRADSMGSVAKRELGKTRTLNPEAKAREQAVPPIEDLRLDQSQLLGDVPMSSLWEGAKQRAIDAERIAVPWSSFVENASLVEKTGTQLEQEPKVTPAESAGQMTEGDDIGADTFTLRKGTKRKSDVLESNSSTSSEDEEEETSIAEESPSKEERKQQPEEAKHPERALEGNEEVRLQRKAANKAARAARRKAKAASRVAAAQAESAQGPDLDKDDDFMPFDYGKAQSVLHSQRAGADEATDGKKKRKKAFDPYTSKVANAPKGARRMHGEKVGKSATFKK